MHCIRVVLLLGMLEMLRAGWLEGQRASSGTSLAPLSPCQYELGAAEWREEMLCVPIWCWLKEQGEERARSGERCSEMLRG